ncbi:glycosyltransferase family 2 protein [Salinimicrobium sp. MT39]|uniref:Glycosyltransferase family 2 protein n=1 Tax=Salinimicrobium profundisediminis TaxID=2994553 RepID=A0A9X3CVA5_9FLAO|nr:glycosyltransferase family 2 protein [Salinimicrobium profundisediminis]
MKVYVVIVTFNAKRWINKCFGSLQSSLIPLNVIVIDNGSTDGTQSFIKRNFSEVDFIQSSSNLGFGAANNIGIQKAYKEHGDYIFLLNQDAWVENNTIEKLIAIARSNKEYGVLSPMHYNGTGSALDYNFSTFIGADRCKGLTSDLAVRKPLKEIYAVNFVNAAAWLLTRNCLETVGGFNPSFYHYSEDLNYADRVRFHQLKIGIVPSVKIFHDRQSRKSNRFLKNPEVNFERIVIRELSRPEIKKTLSYFYLISFIKFTISLFRFEKKGIQIALREVQTLLRLKYFKTAKNRTLSMNRGLTFLK